ncbi:MAG: CopG family transcriptional regulator [Chloroflexota bacterium]
MRRTQIYLDEPLDDLLNAWAAREHRSKASLIREAVAGYYGADESSEPDPDDPMEAFIHGAVPGAVDDIDGIVYGSPHGRGPDWVEPDPVRP